jgi:hypothetical protein
MALLFGNQMAHYAFSCMLAIEATAVVAVLTTVENVSHIRNKHAQEGVSVRV